jgi:hypothetical protein
LAKAAVGLGCSAEKMAAVAKGMAAWGEEAKGMA